MQGSHHTVPSPDRYVHAWLPDEDTEVRAIVHIAHGMSEHGARYARFAEVLTARGYAVYANDHRGHGHTAATAADLGYFGDGVGWDDLIADLRDVVVHERGLHPGVPLVLLGHSMGSLFVQQYLYTYGDTIDAAVLSATSGPPGLLARVGKHIARFERMRMGPRGRSKLLNKLSFEDFNKAFKPNRTTHDWLSRDEAEVDKYVADPWCGFIASTALWAELLSALGVFTRPENQLKIRKNLPIYCFAGERDPVGHFGKGVKAIVQSYRGVGLTHVSMKLYPDGRHEMLNETNRDQVMADVAAWIDDTVKELQ